MDLDAFLAYDNSCRRCGERFEEGDEYYDLGDRAYCPDCFDAYVSSELRRVKGDVIDRI